MKSQITKRQLRSLLGLKNDAALAKYFPVSTAAVAQWSEDEPVPERRLLQAITRNPEAFEGAFDKSEERNATGPDSSMEAANG